MGRLHQLLLSLIFIIPLLGFSENGEEIDAKHQAMYLYNLIRYIDWQSEKAVVGIIGNDEVMPELKRLAQRNSKVEVKLLSDFKGEEQCNMVFLPNATNATFYQTQQEIGNSNTVLVVDKKKLILSGAEMGFYMENEELKFGMNNNAVAKTGIKISNSLLEKFSAF